MKNGACERSVFVSAVLQTPKSSFAAMTAKTSPAYIGRFAPTPSGHLHFGSLVAALASYLDARSVGGRWLLRMEDLDPPREEPGAQAAILKALESYGFEWDGEMIRQSERHEAYAQVLNQLFNHGLAYACTCSRKQLEPYHGIYPGLCRNAGHASADAAIRLRVPELEYHFIDRVQGEYRQHLGRDVGDFVIRRRDGLYAYQLAVVLDDAWQGITDIVRGADLLDSTPYHLRLQRARIDPEGVVARRIIARGGGAPVRGRRRAVRPRDPGGSAAARPVRAGRRFPRRGERAERSDRGDRASRPERLRRA